MSKTVREIAIALGADASSMVKEKQRIRDEFKRQNIKPKKQGNRFVVSDKDANKVILKLKAKNEESSNNNEDSSKKNEESSIEESFTNQQLLKKIEELKKENSKIKEESSKKNEEIRRLNSKIEGYADDFKDMLKNQQELTARSQQLEYETHEQKKKLLSTQKELDDRSKNEAELQDKINKVNEAPLWDRIWKKW